MKSDSQTLDYDCAMRGKLQPKGDYCSTCRHTHGFALVELMIAMAIALFLLLGLAGIFYSTRQTYSAQTGLSQLQDNERVAMSIVANTIQSAGYFPNPKTQTAANVFTAVPPYPASATIYGTTTPTVSVRFQTASGDGVMDCLGDQNSSGATVMYDNLFQIKNNALQCTLDPTSPKPITQTLVDNISNFQVKYGVDQTGAGSVTQYVTAGLVTSWSNVKSVMITWTFTDPSANQPGVSTSTTPTPLEQFTQVIQLQN